ncbi:MAG: FG-GAP-like repeat-containing protein [Myxococcales bacterium]
MGVACDDNDPCTVDNRCDARGSCSGVLHACPSRPCRASTCDGKGGCVDVDAPRGDPCGGFGGCALWACDGAGHCMGTPAGDGHPCDEGTCCGGRCTPTDTDPKHCGSCAAPCATGERCWGGRCSTCTPVLAPFVTYDTGAYPMTLVLADTNGDSRRDLVTANNSGGSVSILTNAGAGTFGAHRDWPSGYDTASVAVGDLDGNGKPDIVATRKDYALLSVMLADGQGGYGAPTTYPVGVFPQSVAVGDLNGDGWQDVAVASVGGARVLLNKGDGTLDRADSYPTGAGPVSVAIGDLNRDGKPDLAVANDMDDTVTVLLNSGYGTFFSATSYPTGAYPVSVAIGDLDGDGWADLAVACSSGTAMSRTAVVSVLLNHAGTFAQSMDYPVGTGWLPQSVAMGDLDGDGDRDLVVASFQVSKMSLFTNQGDGTFAPKVDLATAPTGWTNVGGAEVAVGDLDGDRMPDVAVANAYWDKVDVFLNTCQ